MSHKDVIRSLIQKYNACQQHQYQITRWPDEENSQTRDIDADAREAIPLAIEHTRVESFFGQLEDNARFGDHYGQLEAELKHAFSYHLTLSLPLFAFQKGTKWAAIKNTIRGWLLANASAIPEGSSCPKISGVPFSVQIDRDNKLPNSFFVTRRGPSDEEIQIELMLKMAAALNSKNDQLKKYRADGSRTVLVLESSDIALMSPARLYKAFLEAQNHAATSNIDEFWLARSYIFGSEVGCHLYCLSGPELSWTVQTLPILCGDHNIRNTGGMC
jgi:hypothetical protein